jgi:1-acyl-sn-glycerol-3-phosphate acyltransferase
MFPINALSGQMLFKIRSILVVTMAIIVTAFVSCAVVIINIFFPSGILIRKIARFWAKTLLYISRIRVEVIGMENVSTEKPQIFMANHQGDFDILIFLAHIPVDFLWTVKKELFRVPVFGRALRKAGYIEIDRQNHENAMKGLEETEVEISKGISIATFPEGTRSEDGRILPFKQGMFYLAIQTGVPIVPVTIIGSNKILPKGSLKVSPGKIIMAIDKPVEAGNYTIESRNALIKKVQKIISANHEKYRRETIAAPDMESP